MTVARRVFEALGGTCELYAVGVDETAPTRGEAWIHTMHDRLTRFAPSSELSRLNAAAGRWQAVSPELEAILRESLRAYDLSDGLVHVGVLAALLAAGYTRTFDEGPSEPAAPAPPPPPLPEMLQVEPGRAFLAAGAQVDLGGIAKGWLADRLAETLGPNVLVNLCGDLYARGGGEIGEGWPVGFGGETLLLRDGGAATSGTTARAWGPGLHHLIDPRTGAPAKSDLSEVSVLAQSATEAEILAKTALLLGAREAPRFLACRSAGWWLRPADASA